MNTFKLQDVSPDIWREIYQYQDPQEVIKYASSSKSIYEQVWKDLRSYWKNKCGKSTDNYSAVPCLSSEACFPICTATVNFTTFFNKLPMLDGLPVVFQSYPFGVPEGPLYSSTIINVMIRLQRSYYIESDGKRHWKSHVQSFMDPSVKVSLRDGFILNILRKQNPYLDLTLNIKDTNFPLGYSGGNHQLWINGSELIPKHWSFGHATENSPANLRAFITITPETLRFLTNFKLLRKEKKQDTNKDLEKHDKQTEQKQKEIPQPLFRYHGPEEARVPKGFDPRGRVLRKRLRDARSDVERQRLRESLRLNLIDRAQSQTRLND